MNFQDPNFQDMVFGIALTIWILAWKGFALWKASKNNQRNWFVLILVINTFGLVELIYLVFFQTKGRYWEIIKTKILSTSPVSIVKKK